MAWLIKPMISNKGGTVEAMVQLCAEIVQGLRAKPR